MRSVASSASGVTCSTSAVGPAMPALFTSTSRPPRCVHRRIDEGLAVRRHAGIGAHAGMAAGDQRLGVHVGDEHLRAAIDEAVGHHPADAVAGA